MDVRSTKKLEYISFEDLPEGAVFLYEGEYYMKFYKGNQAYNAVSLDGYCLRVVDNYERVIFVKGFFLMED